MLSCASPVTPAPGERWTERRAVAWPQETVQVEPHGGDGLGETPEGVSPRPGASRHDTWAVARTQHGPGSTALAPSAVARPLPLDRPASPRERHSHRGSVATGPVLPE